MSARTCAGSTVVADGSWYSSFVSFISAIGRLGASGATICCFSTFAVWWSPVECAKRLLRFTQLSCFFSVGPREWTRRRVLGHESRMVETRRIGFSDFVSDASRTGSIKNPIGSLFDRETVGIDRRSRPSGYRSIAYLRVVVGRLSARVLG